MKNIFFLLLLIPLTSCTDQELGWFIISPNNIEGLTNLKFLLSGLTTTIYISIISIIISMVLGLIVAIPSLAKNKFLTYINIGYVEIVRAVPLLVLIFGINLELLPVSGWGNLPGDKILPSITLGFAYAAYIARLSRGGMLEVLSQDFIRTARAKGLSERVVVTKHAMQGGLIPVVSFLGPAVAGLLAGSFVVETIFQIPGLGRFYVEAAFNRDYTMILGTTIFFSAMIVFFNLLSDMAVMILNPRARD